MSQICDVDHHLTVLAVATPLKNFMLAVYEQHIHIYVKAHPAADVHSDHNPVFVKLRAKLQKFLKAVLDER